MFFKRTHSCSSPHTREELKKRLIGDHIKIHNLDFEAIEDNRIISIFPHTEQVTEIKTLPITHVDLQETDGKMKVIITSKIRELDLGGPQLVMILCFLLVIVAVVLFLAFGEDKKHIAAYIVLGVGLFTFIMFWIRMQNGYFDYVRKVKAHIISKVN